MAKKSEKVFRFLIYILPGVLFFSYYPLIHFGSSESMNFEISLPMIWLVLFDILAVGMMWERGMLWKELKNKWIWLLLPAFLSLSALWSLNPLRGLLTMGVLWLIYIAVFGFWGLKELFIEASVKEKFWKAFFGSTLVMCAWCYLQCILDLVGVPRENSLMCAGCTYEMFGFPHPNGLAIEPQFMGNLLLAPATIAAWMLLKKQGDKSLGNKYSKFLPLYFFIIVVTLFLTFSRGAIYAFAGAMAVLTVWMIIKEKRQRKIVGKRMGLMWLVVFLAFGFTLNLQGIMAAASPTNDSYVTGITKVINHLSLGTIDLRVDQGDTAKNELMDSGEVVEKPVENQVDNTVEKEAAFDGYVAESTDTRLKLTGAAVQVWSSDLRTMLFGVGLGGAGQALYEHDLSPAPKEIVQNQYASILLEAGMIGILLVIFTLILVLRAVWRSPEKIMLTCLLIAYSISLLFFSGLPNALHIYLLPMLVYSMTLRKKLVS